MGKRNKKSNFIVQGSILAIAGILSRVIGLIYRVPLHNMMGSEAYGIYSSAFNIYSILLLLSSYSLPLAVSKLVAGKIATGEFKSSYRIFKGALSFALIVGGAMALITFFGANFFATVILSKEEAAFAIKLLAPTIFIMAFLGVFRGYFQGLGTMIPTALSQLVEQIFNAVFSLLGAYLLISQGLKLDTAQRTSVYADSYGAAGGTIGTGVGALSALVLCAFIFLLYRRVLYKHLKRDKSRKRESYSTIIKGIVSIAIPVILSSTVYNISTLIDNSFFGYYMTSTNQSDVYMSIFGIYSGIYYVLINIPIAISNALGSSVIPALSAAVANRNKGQILSQVSSAIRFSMLIAIPASVGMMVLSKPIVGLLFSTDTGLGADLLCWGAFAIIFFSLSTMTNALLQGIGQTSVPVRNALISLVIHIVLLVLFLYGLKMNVYGVVLANMFFGLTMCILNGISLAEILHYRQEYLRTFILPAICSLIMGVAAYGVYRILFMLTSMPSIALFVSIIIAVIVYFILLLITNCVDEVELYGFPMGKKLVAIAKAVHLLSDD